MKSLGFNCPLCCPGDSADRSNIGVHRGPGGVVHSIISAEDENEGASYHDHDGTSFDSRDSHRGPSEEVFGGGSGGGVVGGRDGSGGEWNGNENLEEKIVSRIEMNASWGLSE